MTGGRLNTGDAGHDLDRPAWVQRHPVASVILGLPMIVFGVAVVFGQQFPASAGQPGAAATARPVFVNY
jgi:hypothetical protein